MIIGLSGYARSGKDEAAKVLVEEFGFIRVAFADKLRDFLYALNPMVSADTWENSLAISPVYLTDVIDDVGWDGYKETFFGQEIRRLLQRLGTEAGRDTMWPDIWVDAAFAGIDVVNQDVVVTDVRFPNEAHAITDRGGELWRIAREGIGPANNHPSETSLDNWDFDRFVLNNFHTAADYRTAIKNMWLKRNKNFSN